MKSTPARWRVVSFLIVPRNSTADYPDLTNDKAIGRHTSRRNSECLDQARSRHLVCFKLHSVLCGSLLLFLLIMQGLLVGAPCAASPLVGDLNDDGAVNAQDLQLQVNVILGTETDSTIVSRADLNSDGSRNALD